MFIQSIDAMIIIMDVKHSNFNFEKKPANAGLNNFYSSD